MKPEGSTAVPTRWEDVPVDAMGLGVTRQFVSGTNLMLARVVLETGGHVPRHSHSNEQMTHVVSGALRFQVGEEELVLRAGEVLAIPGDMPHEASALEPTVALDLFTPPLADWLAARAKG